MPGGTRSAPGGRQGGPGGQSLPRRGLPADRAGGSHPHHRRPRPGGAVDQGRRATAGGHEGHRPPGGQLQVRRAGRRAHAVRARLPHHELVRHRRGPAHVHAPGRPGGRGARHRGPSAVRVRRTAPRGRRVAGGSGGRRGRTGHPRPVHDQRLLERAGGEPYLVHPRRLLPHRRPGPAHTRAQPGDRRPRQGRHQPRGREGIRRRGRGAAARPRGHRRRRRGGPARRRTRRGRPRVRRPERGPGQAPSLPEVKRYLAGRGLAAFKLPDEVRELPALPRTPVGKIDKVALRATAASGRPPERHTPDGPARQPSPA